MLHQVIIKNRWLVWTIVLAVAISMLTISYANFVIGDLEQITTNIIW